MCGHRLLVALLAAKLVSAWACWLAVRGFIIFCCPAHHHIRLEQMYFGNCDPSKYAIYNRRRKKTWCLVKFIKLGSFLSVTVGVPTFWSPNSLNNWLIKIYGRKDAFFQGVIFKLLPRFNPCNYIVGFIGLILLQKPYSPQDFSFFLVDPLFDRCVIYLLGLGLLYFVCLFTFLIIWIFFNSGSSWMAKTGKFFWFIVAVQEIGSNSTKNIKIKDSHKSYNYSFPYHFLFATHDLRSANAWFLPEEFWASISLQPARSLIVC